ncbi:MAG: DNA repair protein RecO [Verrucomicrobia bacterium]|nr:DNA repair protein RecO [Verrucomicrobiota bacterium]
MLAKCDAIVLDYYAFSNTSRTVTWLTRRHGKIATVIKGSQRPKSPFLGQYDLFYTCELVFYERERNYRHIARECTPVSCRPNLRRDWKACSAASYVTALIKNVTQPHAPVRELFYLLDTALDDLNEHGAGTAFIFWFELKLLEILGLSPRLSHCTRCGRQVSPTETRLRFSYAEGSLLCSKCKSEADSSSMPIARDVLATLLGWQKSKHPRTTRSTRVKMRQADEIRNLLGLFLSYHLDVDLKGRKIALDVISRVVGHYDAVNDVREAN